MYIEHLGPIYQKNFFKSTPTLDQAVRKLQRGEVLAFPTETVYGIGASIFNNSAVQRLYIIKHKPKEQALPVYISNLNQINFLAADIPQEFNILADKLLPASITIILKKHSNISSPVTGSGKTIAIHLSPHPLVQRLIELTGCPLVVTSANTLGKPRSIQARHVLEDFNGRWTNGLWIRIDYLISRRS